MIVLFLTAIATLTVYSFQTINYLELCLLNKHDLNVLIIYTHVYNIIEPEFS